ncbi:ABC-F family ATP-binding cassette domain-containing protein [Mediterraneibacter sp. NSJ-55]|uniref:ABC-F family ATP-binding cassette domain-containing protein n=1 Tax=Mediterraneibacter hominis TaxID=2763054 RepID=A0A923LG20_9FIRM|nr:ABC-F family ATP-binding cassette domain-containing protein [Mediterraneibacter hominis]MBC5688045.1 ABC-F family ATP-binding cassette domain-containing protein [Mediterraneibacter hominis]
MNILNIEHISKIYGEKCILDDVSYGIHEEDKIGIIGINGTGKTTFLKIIAGLETADAGQIVTKNGVQIAYLPQNPVFTKEETVLSYVMAGKIQKEEWKMASEAKRILNRLGLLEHEADVRQLSGGQKKRAALARTLINPAEILILDEPTNHLDNEMVVWLEEYLNRFKGSVIMVTHDRYFLDRVTNRILEISHGKLFEYEANYSRFLELKALREEMEAASQRKRNSILRAEIEWAKRGCRARSTKQKARLLRLKELKNQADPNQDRTVEIESVQSRMGKKTIELSHICKGYKEKPLLTDFSYIVLKNQRLGIIGENGCGKSTLMKLLAGELEPDRGTIEIGETVKIGYFAQETPQMDTTQRVIDSIREVGEYVPVKEGKISASQMLERFLFDAALQYTPVSKLSGGEKRRLYLLKVLMSAPNVLLLDEPTNDLDIPTLHILEEYLDSFAGIVIAVSHDRYFLDTIADRIFAFEGNGRLVQYEGGYTDYLEAKQAKEGEKAPREPKEKKGEKDKKQTWKKNQPAKLKFSYQEQREYACIDEEIEKLENTIQSLEEEVLKNATNSARLYEIMKEKEQVEKQLEEKTERWIYLNELAEQIEQQKMER